MTRIAIAAVLAALSTAAAAQTAEVSPTSPSPSSPGAVSRTPPSGSTIRPEPGVPQVGAPTPTEQQEERNSRKDTTSVCKGC